MKTQERSPAEVHTMIEAAARAASAEVRRVPEFPIGKAIRQGDVYLVRMPDGTPVGDKLATRQLVDGVTQGSRHIAEGQVALHGPCDRRALPDGVRSDALLGPALIADAPWTLTHPEHAHVTEIPAGTYQSIHQLDAATQQRVAD
jgi:hypothetical protein